MDYKIFESLPAEAKYIRQNVFVDEQKFTEEFDTIDNYARHIVLYQDGKAVATGRYYTDDNIEYHIGRVAVLAPYRKYGYGKKIIELIEQDTVNLGAKKLVLSAQCRAQGFYEKCGYTAVGDIYYDEYCEHIKMYKNI